MNKKSKEIVKKLCFTLVIVISIITIIGCPNTVSNKANGMDNKKPDTPTPKPQEDKPVDPNDWSGLTADKVILRMKIKDKSDEIVHSKDGLSFGWRDNKLCLLSTEDHYPAGSNNANYPLEEAFEKIKARIGDEGVAFIPTSFDSVSDGLKKRWIAAKETKYTKGGSMWLDPCIETTVKVDEYLLGKLKQKQHMLTNKGLYRFSNESMYFAVDKNIDFFVYIDVGSVRNYFADWHLVFVPKEGSLADLESYSFHYGPYTLRGNFDKDNPKVPVSYGEYVHVFTLSRMLEDYLRNKKKVPEDIAKQVVKKFSDDKDKYDVYLVIGKVFSSGATMFGYERVEYSFRNVLKLNGDAYTDRWINCWTRDESDQDGFPSLLPLPSP